MKAASALYRLLGDEARLRLLRVLDKDRFNVKELTGILGLAQSGVSRHLGLLKESELVVEERDGAYTFSEIGIMTICDKVRMPARPRGKAGLPPPISSRFRPLQRKVPAPDFPPETRVRLQAFRP